MITLKLKVVMLPALDVADSVSVAEMELPTARTAPPRFQVKVRYVLAFEGAQFPVVMESVRGRVPVFLTYTVLVTEFPGVIAPQSRVVQFWVQPLSE